MTLQLLYFDDCPHWTVTEARLHEALRATGRTDVVERVLVTTTEEAEARGFLGSPSVQVDGRDPFAEPGARTGLSCRLYRTPDGPAGAPTVDQLIEALAR